MPCLLRLTGADAAWLAVFLVFFSILAVRVWVLGRPQIGALRLGPLSVSPFGLAVGLGLLFGFHLFRRWCDCFGLDGRALSRALPWIAALGVYISHLVSIAAYSPHELTNPMALLDFRTGLSSFGALFGSAVVAIVFLRRHRLPAWPYADAMVYAGAGGLIFVRLGCFAVHDHPGGETGFPLAVEMNGVPRHDLGLYEMLLMLVIFVLLHLPARREMPPAGTLVAVAVLVYAPVRIMLEGLRVGEIRYAGMTPGQWFSLPLFAIGVWALTSARADARRRRAE